MSVHYDRAIKHSSIQLPSGMPIPLLVILPEKKKERGKELRAKPRTITSAKAALLNAPDRRYRPEPRLD